MKQTMPFVKAACLAVCLALLLGRAAILGQKRASAATADAARQFLSALTPEERAKATFRFDDQERVTWYFIPIARKGLTLKEMTPAHRIYERMGFVRAPERDWDPLPGLTLVAFVLPLRPAL